MCKFSGSPNLIPHSPKPHFRGIDTGVSDGSGFVLRKYRSNLLLYTMIDTLCSDRRPKLDPKLRVRIGLVCCDSVLHTACNRRRR